MSIQNTGTTIRLARKEAGLTQEKLSEGICSVTMLSQVENGARGISSSAFEALMTRAGKSVKAIPCFTNRDDFDCFYSLKKAHFYISCWQFQNAYRELEFVESLHWANSKLHYAEWLLLHAKIQFYSGQGNHEHNYHMLLECLSVTNPQLSVSDFASRLLSLIEIETVIMIAHESLYTNHAESSYRICTQLIQYIEHSHFSNMDKTRLLAETNIILAKYYLSKKQYEFILPTIEFHRKEMALLHMDMPLLQLTFLNALCLYHLGRQDDALHFFKVTLYSAHCIGSYYYTICVHYIQDNLKALCTDELFPLDDIPSQHYPEKSLVDASTFSDGTYDLHSSSALTIGRLIREMRKEQNLSQQVLCQGLCSKAKLSKIESDKQQASILLIEALLQRLGISERYFTFWGSDRENEFHDLKFKAIHFQQLRADDLKKYLQRMEELTTEEDILQKQFIQLRKAFFCPTPEERLSLLFEALHYTLPDFDISRIHEYRLSWAELTALNVISKIYAETSDGIKSIYYFTQLCDYYKMTVHDVLLRSNTYCGTRNMYCYSLYKLKHYSSILHTFGSSFDDLYGSSILSFGSFLFYYSQAQGECNHIDKAELYGYYACAMEYLMCIDANADGLKQYLYDDFSISLNI